jgi:hypothetical protein
MQSLLVVVVVVQESQETEVQQLVTEKIKSYKISLAGPDQNYAATANDLGLVFNS